MTGAHRDPDQDAAERAQDAAERTQAQRVELERHTVGEPLTLGNEFSEITVAKVQTRNGTRLLVSSPKSGQWVALCPLELEALTWQCPATFSAMIGNPYGPLIDGEDG